MIRSLIKINIIKLIFIYGVISKDFDLLLKTYPEFVSVNKIKNAIKTLKEKGFITMVRISSYKHNSNHEKDVFVLTDKGKKEGERIMKKNYPKYKRPKMLVSRHKNEQFDLLLRLYETNLFFRGNKSFISRDSCYDLFPYELTHEVKSLRFHGSFTMDGEQAPIYHVKDCNKELNLYREKKFFEIINEDSAFGTKCFSKLLLANDERIIEKLITNLTKENTPNFLKAKEKTYVYFPHRKNEKTYLVTKKMSNDILFFLGYPDIYSTGFEKGVFSRYPMQKRFERSVVINTIPNGSIYLNPMLLYEVETVYNWYAYFLNHIDEIKEKSIKIVFLTHETNYDLFSYTFKDFDFVSIKICNHFLALDYFDASKKQ